MSHSTEKLRREHLWHVENFRYRKNLGIKCGAGLSCFCAICFCLTVTKFRRGTLYYVTKFKYRNCFLCKMVRSHFAVQNFLSHSGDYFRRDTPLCFRKFPVLEKITDNRGGEKHDFLSKLSFLTTKLFRTGTILCFRMFRVSNSQCQRGDHHDFLSRNCCFKVPKSFVGEPFSVSLLSGIETFLLNRVRSRFSINIFFVSQYQKISYWKIFCAVVQRTSGPEKFYR